MARYPHFVPHIDVALIGGTGIGSRLAQLGGKPLHLPTPFGMLRGSVLQHQGSSILLVQRHAAGHKVPPHRVNYLAMASGLAQLGVKGCMSSAAVGCLRPEWPVGTLLNCDDFLDLSGRRLTQFHRTVEHVDFTRPFSLHPLIRQVSSSLGMDVKQGATYLTNDGPRYETPAEIKMMRTLGADIVGMTASTEAIALREAGVPYGCIAVVTNLAAGLSPTDLHHGEVTDVMNERGHLVVDLMLACALEITHHPLPA